MSDRFGRGRGTADDGFTLVEILVAIVIAGVRAAVVVVGVGTLVDTAAPPVAPRRQMPRERRATRASRPPERNRRRWSRWSTPASSSSVTG